MSAPKKPVDATIDSVAGALSYLFDWLGSERAEEEAPDVFELLGDGDGDDDDDVIETEGEDA